MKKTLRVIFVLLVFVWLAYQALSLPWDTPYPLFFLLLLGGSVVLRLRLYPWSVLPWAECLLCLATSALWWPSATFGLALPLLYFAENGRWLPALLAIGLGLLVGTEAFLLYLFFCGFTLLLGSALRYWQAEEDAWIQQADEEQRKNIHLQNAREEMQRALVHSARMAGAQERGRIAQEIHDHVGHEITGALMALQTAKKLHEKGDPRHAEMLDTVIVRMQEASVHLREAVHNLRPPEARGNMESLRSIVEDFAHCPVSYKAEGDFTSLTAPAWEFLHSALKEALTNVARHSNASAVRVEAIAMPEEIRLTVMDNGSIPEGAPMLRRGLGLTGMRERALALGGECKAQRLQEGFRLTLRLPRAMQRNSAKGDENCLF